MTPGLHALVLLVQQQPDISKRWEEGQDKWADSSLGVLPTSTIGSSSYHLQQHAQLVIETTNVKDNTGVSSELNEGRKEGRKVERKEAI
jgi:hypothetical protein